MTDDERTIFREGSRIKALTVIEHHRHVFQARLILLETSINLSTSRQNESLPSGGKKGTGPHGIKGHIHPGMKSQNQ